MEQIAAKEEAMVEPLIVRSLTAAELVARRKAAIETPSKIASPKHRASQKGISEETGPIKMKRTNPETLVVEIPWHLSGDSDPKFAASVEKWTRDMLAATAHGAALLHESEKQRLEISEKLKQREICLEELKGDHDWPRLLEKRTQELTAKLEAAQTHCVMLESSRVRQDNTIALLKDQLVKKDKELGDLNAQLAKQHEINLLTGRYKAAEVTVSNLALENPSMATEVPVEFPRLDLQTMHDPMPKLEEGAEETIIPPLCGAQTPAFKRVHRKRKKLTSDVWNDFHHVIDIDPGNGSEHRFGICKTCNRKLDADPKGKGTTYLRSHANHCKKRKQRTRCPSCSCPSCKI